MKSKSMSIYLLKPHSTVEDALEDGRDYREASLSNKALRGSRVFLRVTPAKQPWWRDYLGISDPASQQSSSALAFIEVRNRIFALTFGSGHFLLKDDSFEHDFGTRVVLNSVDPNRLKSADTLDPESSQRRRTQIPFDGDLALLSFTGDSTVLKSLTGKAKKEYQGLVKSVTGSASLRITTPAEPNELDSLLNQLLALYESEEFSSVFPDIAQISPLTDPTQIEPLNRQLLDAVFDRTSSIILSVPDILDYSDETYVQFSGRGTSHLFSDVYIKHYREYLEDRGLSRDDLDVEGLKHDRLVLLDGSFALKKKWSIFQSLILEVEGNDGYSYHFSDGTWYKVSKDLVNSLRQFLDPFWIDCDLPENVWLSEDTYNEHASVIANAICLDRSNITPKGQHQIEPCDILRIDGQGIDLVHVKMGTSSSLLSHLFNQAANSMQLLRIEPESVQKLESLVTERADAVTASNVRLFLESGQARVSIAIVSHKRTPEKKSDNLPFFSRISLRRTLGALMSMRVPTSVQLVPDRADRAGKKKPTKSQNAKSTQW